MPTSTDISRDALISQIKVKSKSEARATIRESFLIDRGFLTRKTTLAIAVSAIALVWISPWASLGLCAILLCDYGWFVVRRRRVLKWYRDGTPRLRTAEDFAAISAAFKRDNVLEPDMSDWHEAAGFDNVAQWREELRYKIAASHYRGGTLLDVGSGDGRLCWKYHVCDPSNYIGVDVAPGLLETLRQKTAGQATGILAVAEHLTLPESRVDLVICSEAFEHLPEPGEALVEFNRVLKRGGRILIQSPNAMRIRNLNPFHLALLIAGFWVPKILLPKVVHENTFATAFTYHWDFTRQQIREYARHCPGLSIVSLRGATYRFNPDGNFWHRVSAAAFRLPVVHWLGWDMTIVMEKRP
ncbi:MAG: class I SAM-dependent methyltransferase [Candidatus Acidiferrales bacterium]